jgi:cytochrome c
VFASKPERVWGKFKPSHDASKHEKYKDDPNAEEYLINKVRNGGTGVWGQIPMSPHNGISQEDAEAMVTYILTIK